MTLSEKLREISYEVNPNNLPQSELRLLNNFKEYYSDLINRFYDRARSGRYEIGIDLHKELYEKFKTDKNQAMDYIQKELAKDGFKITTGPIRSTSTLLELGLPQEGFIISWKEKSESKGDSKEDLLEDMIKRYNQAEEAFDKLIKEKVDRDECECSNLRCTMPTICSNEEERKRICFQCLKKRYINGDVK